MGDRSENGKHICDLIGRHILDIPHPERPEIDQDHEYTKNGKHLRCDALLEIHVEKGTRNKKEHQGPQGFIYLEGKPPAMREAQENKGQKESNERIQKPPPKSLFFPVARENPLQSIRSIHGQHKIHKMHQPAGGPEIAKVREEFKKEGE